VVFQFLLSSGQVRSILRMGLLASTITAFLPTQVNFTRRKNLLQQVKIDVFSACHVRPPSL
jgi:hypothetical protein